MRRARGGIGLDPGECSVASVIVRAEPEVAIRFVAKRAPAPAAGRGECERHGIRAQAETPGAKMSVQ
jgi:hypothetical protein